MNMTVNITPTSPHPVDNEKFDQFEKELARLVNVYSMEKYCNLPDHVIAKYLRASLESLSNTQVSCLEFFRI